MVYIFDMGGYIFIAHPKTIHREYLLIGLVTDSCLMFFYYLGFMGTVSTSWGLELKAAFARAFNSLLVITVSSVLFA